MWRAKQIAKNVQRAHTKTSKDNQDASNVDRAPSVLEDLTNASIVYQVPSKKREGSPAAYRVNLASTKTFKGSQLTNAALLVHIKILMGSQVARRVRVVHIKILMGSQDARHAHRQPLSVNWGHSVPQAALQNVQPAMR